MSVSDQTKFSTSSLCAFIIVLILAVVEFNFFIVAYMGPCFGSVLNKVLITRRFSCCWTVLTQH